MAMRRSIEVCVYRMQIESGSFIKTSITREYVKVDKKWYYREPGMNKSWKNCAAGAVTMVEGDSRFIDTPSGRAMVDGTVIVNLNVLPT